MEISQKINNRVGTIIRDPRVMAFFENQKSHSENSVHWCHLIILYVQSEWKPTLYTLTWYSYRLDFLILAFWRFSGNSDVKKQMVARSAKLSYSLLALI